MIKWWRKYIMNLENLQFSADTVSFFTCGNSVTFGAFFIAPLHNNLPHSTEAGNMWLFHFVQEKSQMTCFYQKVYRAWSWESELNKESRSQCFVRLIIPPWSFFFWVCRASPHKENHCQTFLVDTPQATRTHGVEYLLHLCWHLYAIQMPAHLLKVMAQEDLCFPAVLYKPVHPWLQGWLWKQILLR